MKIIGLTGNIGTGKSFVAQCFLSMGMPVFDSDKVTHDLLAEGGNAVKPVSEIFPEAFDGKKIERQLLRELVFKHPEKLTQLEDILHPLLAKEREKLFQQCRDEDNALVVWDSPLLFEKGLDHQCDIIIVTTVSEQEQDSRVLARDNAFTKEQLKHVKRLQLSQSEKVEKADIVIDTLESKENIRERIKHIVELLVAQHQKKGKSL